MEYVIFLDKNCSYGHDSDISQNFGIWFYFLHLNLTLTISNNAHWGQNQVLKARFCRHMWSTPYILTLIFPPLFTISYYLWIDSADTSCIVIYRSHLKVKTEIIVKKSCLYTLSNCKIFLRMLLLYIINFLINWFILCYKVLINIQCYLSKSLKLLHYINLYPLMSRWA